MEIKMEEEEDEEEVNQLVQIYKELDEDQQLDFFIKTQDIINKFVTIDKREQTRLYYNNRYKTDEVYRENYKAKQRENYKKRQEKKKANK